MEFFRLAVMAVVFTRLNIVFSFFLFFSLFLQEACVRTENEFSEKGKKTSAGRSTSLWILNWSLQNSKNYRAFNSYNRLRNSLICFITSWSGTSLKIERPTFHTKASRNPESDWTRFGISKLHQINLVCRETSCKGSLKITKYGKNLRDSFPGQIPKISWENASPSQDIVRLGVSSAFFINIVTHLADVNKET